MSSSSLAAAVLPVQLPTRPYPGLRPFEKDEWPVFFGRERICDDVVRLVCERQMVVVHGDSGSGKSSLVRAGVLSRLEQESRMNRHAWRTVCVLPRGAPLQKLAAALVELHLGGDVTDLLRILYRGATAGRQLGEQWLKGQGSVCILIDQFEELFSSAICTDAWEAQAFAEFLVGFQQSPPDGINLILTMRSEFIGACARFAGLAEAVNATQFLLPRMGRDDLLAAIRRPAKLYGGVVDNDLAERLIADASGSQDPLPLIQHGLMLLHQELIQAPVNGEAGAPWRLTADQLADRGGLIGLLSNHANAIMQRAEEAGAKPHLVREVFQALLDVAADGSPLRRPQTLAALVAATGSSKEEVLAVIDLFRSEDASLVRPVGTGPIADADLVDVTHEALLRCWDKISDSRNGWLAEEIRDGLIWRSLLDQSRLYEESSEHLLSPATADERALWLRGRNSVWAQRYGGGWENVERLMQASRKAAKRQRWNNFLLLLLVFICGISLLVIRLIKHEATENKKQAELSHKSEIEGIRIIEESRRLAFVAAVQLGQAEEAREAAVQLGQAEEARAVAENTANETEKLNIELRRQLSDLQARISKLPTSVRKNLQPAVTVLNSAENKTQVAPDNLSKTAEACTSETAKAGGCTLPDTEPSLPVRIYIHVFDETQREAANALQKRLSEMKIGDQFIVVPEVQVVGSYGGKQTTLRCFREQDCQTDGAAVIATINSLLVTPSVSLDDFSSVYSNGLKIRPRHFELWVKSDDLLALSIKL